MTVSIRPGSLEPVLGPLPCIACGRPVVWGVAVQTFARSWDGLVEPVRRRGLYDTVPQQPHRCARQDRVAA